MADGDDETLKKIIDDCTSVQSMIEISVSHLDGLRKQCSTSATLTQQEIRLLETKLIRLFSKQLLIKTKVPDDALPPEAQHHPLLRQWLHVVGLSSNSIMGMCVLVPSVESLLEKTENDIRGILQNSGAEKEEVRRLISALHNLKKCRDSQDEKEKTSKSETLHWDSWDRANNSNIKPSASSPSSSPNRSTRSRHDEAVSRNAYESPEIILQNPQTSESVIENITREWDCHRTPPATPSPFTKKEKIKFPTTPPPHKKQVVLIPEPSPLTKSRSHESQLANRVDQSDPHHSPFLGQSSNPSWVGRSFEHLPRKQRKRLVTVPNLEPTPFDGNAWQSEISSTHAPSPLRSPLFTEDSSLPVEKSPKSLLGLQKSPRTPGYMVHYIQHRFAKIVKISNCDYCNKQMLIGYRCRECKFKCHRDCSNSVPPSCGLPNEFLDMYKKTLHNEINQSPMIIRGVSGSTLKDSSKYGKWIHPNNCTPSFQTHDSSSNTSSCNSSTPSSPALSLLPNHTPPSATSQFQQFQFPDVVDSGKNITIDPPSPNPGNEMVETQKSNDSDKTVSGTSGSTDSDKTYRVDSQDSQISDLEAAERGWPRQNSLSLREWDIPFGELVIGDVIGTGRFGTVHKGSWHGDVAVKFLNMDHVDDERTLDAFKQEVATFRKTRHENLVLFMGACMKPPRLAIVTSLCKGMTLYSHVHVRKERFNMNRNIIIAQQISQGMGYLHARGIVHKDLKTKNIFFESTKVVITDFGLFSVTRLCYGNRKGEWLTIPPGWLCYLSPEIVCRLRAAHDYQENDNLPFTKDSDVYAFGTVWYELLCGEWPFKGHPPEAVIWQVGRGMKQSLANIHVSRDVKEILMLCWSYKPSERPDFGKLFKLLERIPKKRLARSPSHPVHLSRSAESVF